MGGAKRGDHVFNNGLKQFLPKLAGLVQEVLAVESTGRRHGAAERAGRLYQSLLTLRAGLDQRAFGLVVHKPAAGGSDANSKQFGKAQQEMKRAFTQFLLALRNWELATAATAPAAARHLHTACLHLRLVAGRWLDAAIDPAAEALCRQESPASGPDIDAGRRHLAAVRDELAGLIRLYTP